MKNRKTVVVAFLLVAVMLLGVGYAALTDVLDIQGTAEISAGSAQEAFNQDVYFSKVSSGTGYTASINADNNDKGSFTATGFGKTGDKIVITYTIANDSEDHAATVTPKLLQNSNEKYFEISSDWASTAQTIAAGTTKDIIITIELLELPTEFGETGLVTASFNIELTAVTSE